MRMMLALFAAGAGAYALSRLYQENAREGSAAFAGGTPDAGPMPVRDSGPEAMRDPPRGEWTATDEASDQSFPASDPPANY